MKIVCLLCGWLAIVPAKAQQDIFPSRALAMGQIQLNQPPAQALWGNPAEIANLEALTLVSSYQLPYGLKELGTITMGVIIPGKPSWALSLAQYGRSHFKQQQAAVTVAKDFGVFRIGLTTTYWLFSISGIGQYHAWSWNLGFNMRLGPNIELALLMQNLLNIRIFQEEVLNSSIHMGLSWLINPLLKMALEISHGVRTPLVAKIGMEYNLKQKIPFRAGIDFQRKSLHAGLGYLAKLWQLHYALMIQAPLGITHQSSIIIQWR